MESSSPQPPPLPRRSATSSSSARPAPRSSASPRPAAAPFASRVAERGGDQAVFERADFERAGPGRAVSRPAAAGDTLRKVAKFSWYAPLIGIVLAMVVKRIVGPDSPLSLLVGFIQLGLIAAGLICGFAALIGAARRTADQGGGKGITGHAIAGVCVNGALVVLILVLLDSLGNARDAQKKFVEKRLKEMEVAAALEEARLRNAQPALPDPASPRTQRNAPFVTPYTPAPRPPEPAAPEPVPAPRPAHTGPTARAMADPAWRQPLSLQKNLDGEIIMLHFGRSKAVDDAMLKLIATIPTISELHLQNSSITDAGLIHLADLPALQVLSLADTAITDAGMPALSRCNATNLNLANTAITDAGLAQLVKSQRLSGVGVRGTQVTAPGVRAVQRQGLDISGIDLTVATRPPPPTPGRTTRPPRSTTTPPQPVVPKPPAQDPARPPREKPATPSIPVPRAERSDLDRAESKMRFDIAGIRSHAIRNDRKYPAALSDITGPFFRDEHKTDHWGDAYLYLGAGKAYDPFDKSKSLLLATAKPHEGKRVVAYTTGKIEIVDEAVYAAMVAAEKK